MKLLQEERDSIKKISLISGVEDFDQYKTFFEFLVIHIILNYLDGNKTYIPYLGSIVFKGDNNTSEVNFEFELSENIKKIINQIKSGDMEIDIKKTIMRMIKNDLSLTIDPDLKYKEHKIDIEA